MKIVWRARAEADLNALVTYIANESPSGAKRVHDQIIYSVSFLADWPDFGKPGRKPGLREMVVAHTRYVVIYRHNASKVTILRIVHGSRNR